MIMEMEIDEDGADDVQAIRNDLMNEFHALNETRQQIFWFYFLHIFTDRGVGGDLELCGSVFHYKITVVWTASITHCQFKYRAKKLKPLILKFQEYGLRPTGNIPIFLVPLDGRRRPDVVTLDTLRWVRHPRNPQPNKMW